MGFSPETPGTNSLSGHVILPVNNAYRLIYYKKNTGNQTICYLESVQKALCFDWIDGKKK